MTQNQTSEVFVILQGFAFVVASITFNAHSNSTPCFIGMWGCMVSKPKGGFLHLKNREIKTWLEQVFTPMVRRDK
jgi:hypothetical protein